MPHQPAERTGPYSLVTKKRRCAERIFKHNDLSYDLSNYNNKSQVFQHFANNTSVSKDKANPAVAPQRQAISILVQVPSQQLNQA